MARALVHTALLVGLSVGLAAPVDAADPRVVLMNQTASRAGSVSAIGRHPPTADRFERGSTRSEATQDGVHLTVRALPTNASTEHWVEATVSVDPGRTIRAVTLRFIEGSTLLAESEARQAPYRLVTSLGKPATAKATVVLGAIEGRAERTVSLSVSSPLPPAATTPAPSGSPSAPDPMSQAASGPLQFVISISRVELPGAMETGIDVFDCRLNTDKAMLAQVRQIDYELDQVAHGDAEREFFYEGTVTRTRWPITARITWKDGRVTTQTIPRP